METIQNARTANAGWTKQQLAKWGVQWPPPRRWIQFLVDGEGSCQCGTKFLGRNDFYADLYEGVTHTKEQCHPMSGFTDWS
jgi:hypothetical protein